jgi:hypothetical protein
VTATQKAVNPKQFVIDRTLKASVEKVWRMWTTKDGLEKWWGPEDFSSTVSHLDVRAGGRFEIVMTATLPEIIAQLKAITRSSNRTGAWSTRTRWISSPACRRIHQPPWSRCPPRPAAGRG